MTFTLDDLNDTRFEDFCYDLLASQGFVNLSWRKGTGLKSSPSDQGRDIQGELLKKELAGKEYHEKWFIECKHYRKGVPPDKIQGALSWANSERPHVLLIVVSNFLSNPTKQYLDDYKRNNKPSFRIMVWELKDIEHLTAENKSLRLKYDLPTGVDFLPILNNHHINYVMKLKINTVEYLFELMDSLDEEKRDEAFAMTYHDIISPRYRKAESENEILRDLRIDSVDYFAFREKCLNALQSPSPLFVHKVVCSTLAYVFNQADKSSLKRMQEMQEFMIEKLKEDIEIQDDEEKVERLKWMLKNTQEGLENLSDRVESAYQLYCYICDELVRKLLVEQPKVYSRDELKKAIKVN